MSKSKAKTKTKLETQVEKQADKAGFSLDDLGIDFALALIIGIVAAFWRHSLVVGLIVGALVFLASSGALGFMYEVLAAPKLSRKATELKTAAREKATAPAPGHVSPKGEIEEDYDFFMGFFANQGVAAARAGQPFVISLEKAKGIAVNGIPGSGKTTALHYLIYDLVITHSPDDLRLFIVDLKDGLDFGIFYNLPHLHGVPIATSIDEARTVLELAKKEMKRRSELFRSTPRNRLCNDLDRYHKLVAEGLDLPHLPRVLIIVDEVQRLTEKGYGEGIEILTDLGATGRAYGMHPVVATQVPRADAIPTKLTSVLETRMVGMMDERDYYQVAQVYQSYTAGVTLTQGQFFVRTPGYPAWAVVSMNYVDDVTLERGIDALSKGHTPPSWAGIKPDEPQKAIISKRPWNGSADKKHAEMFQFLLGYTDMPPASEATAQFDMSERTAADWIGQVWPQVLRARKNEGGQWNG